MTQNELAERLRDMSDTLNICGADYSDVLLDAARELDRRSWIPQPTLTDEEREAIMRLCEAVAEYSEIDRQENGCHADDDMAAVAVARGLLERTQQVGPAPVERPSAARVTDVGGAGPT
jgi:hypothetical protein